MVRRDAIAASTRGSSATPPSSTRTCIPRTRAKAADSDRAAPVERVQPAFPGARAKRPVAGVEVEMDREACVPRAREAAPASEQQDAIRHIVRTLRAGEAARRWNKDWPRPRPCVPRPRAKVGKANCPPAPCIPVTRAKAVGCRARRSVRSSGGGGRRLSPIRPPRHGLGARDAPAICGNRSRTGTFATLSARGGEAKSASRAFGARNNHREGLEA